VILIFVKVNLGWNSLLSIPGLLLVIGVGVWTALILGCTCRAVFVMFRRSYLERDANCLLYDPDFSGLRLALAESPRRLSSSTRFITWWKWCGRRSLGRRRLLSVWLTVIAFKLRGGAGRDHILRALPRAHSVLGLTAMPSIKLDAVSVAFPIYKLGQPFAQERHDLRDDRRTHRQPATACGHSGIGQRLARVSVMSDRVGLIGSQRRRQDDIAARHGRDL